MVNNALRPTSNFFIGRDAVVGSFLWRRQVGARQRVRALLRQSQAIFSERPVGEFN